MTEINVIVTGPEEAYNNEAEFWCANELMGFSPVGRDRTYASRPAQTVTLSSGRPTFVATSHAAWSSFSVQTSRTTMTAPSSSIVQPACLAAASSADPCSSSSNPSGNVTSNGSDPSGCLPLATRQA
jgi:hypothetical protein